MQQLQVETPFKSAPSYGGIYHQILTAMKVHGLSDLGDPNYREKCGDRFKNKDGEIRSASLDLDIPDRVDRTSIVRSLNDTELELLHQIEERAGRFLVGHEIRRAVKNNSRPTVISEERKKYIEQFNNENRPEMRSVFGVRVPAYFPADNEFDGLIYHHSWDKCVRHGLFDLPALTMKKSGRKLLEDAE